jgi:uncharacterized protein (DUF433 family)
MTQDFTNRIHLNPEILSGKPVIKGTRLSVEFIIGLLSNGMTINDILEEYDGLKQEDILGCLQFAKQNLEESKYYPIAMRA